MGNDAVMHINDLDFDRNPVPARRAKIQSNNCDPFDKLGTGLWLAIKDRGLDLPPVRLFDTGRPPKAIYLASP